MLCTPRYLDSCLQDFGFSKTDEATHPW